MGGGAAGWAWPARYTAPPSVPRAAGLSWTNREEKTLNADELVSQAMQALNQGDPREALPALEAALTANPERLDLRHALAVTHLQLGEPLRALQTNEELFELVSELTGELADQMTLQILLTRAAIMEDLAQPAEAAEAYAAVLRAAPDHAQAQQGLGYLLLAWGRHAEGRRLLQQHVDNETEAPEPREATRAFLDALDRFRKEDYHPNAFLQAHRESYVEFFDFHANRMAEQGWIAEAARMRRDGERVVPIIADGARPYAAMRVDLVNPQTGQPGLVGEEPMVVAIERFEALAHAPVLFPTPSESGFEVWISSQCPWDQLTLQIRFAGPGAVEKADPIIGDWYTAGFNGAFGSSDRGRFHYVSDPESPAPDAVIYQVDCGRAEQRAVEALLQRLVVLHSQHPIRHVVVGRGYLPA